MARPGAWRHALTADRRGTRRVLAIAAIALACTLPGRAQEGNLPATRFFVDVAAGLLADDNFEEIEDPSGTTTLVFSDIVLGYESRRDNQNFRFSTGFRLEAGENPDDPSFNGGLTDPFAAVNFARRGADGNLSFNARFREEDIGTSDEIFDGDDLVLSPGRRQLTTANVRLVLGQSAPIGFSGGVRYVDRRFVDTREQDDFNDGTFVQADARLTFRLTPTTSLNLDTEYSERDDDNAVDRFEENRFIGLGLTHRTPSGLRATVTGGYQVDDVTQTRLATGERFTRTFEEPVLRFNIVQPRPNGEITLGLFQRVVETGLQADLRIGRSLNLPLGAIEATAGIGYTEQDDAVSGVGSLRWTRELPRGRFAITFNQELATEDEENVLRSTAIFSLSQDLTRLSALNLNLNVSAQESIADDGIDRQRVRASLVYSYRLTEDWNLNTGIRHLTSRETGDDPVISNEVFTNIARSFSLRP